ncbi:Liprin-beta homolog [Caenorhabditis elegans]|uniref:Isoform a of Liprin-beta homolog n=1 Tax=Caenorhabditis elegans TaxID=6239 RepID=Q94071-2|nr:Liprin-beta homolog [Caenorhabditis elegans]CAB01771.3 Liprin-beta homolog [Caenorhabditis elegans]|eukprot:NP_510311.2 Liprin-beta [Caenorhabditis elegans]
MYSRHSISDAYGAVCILPEDTLTVSSSQNSHIDAFAALVDRERDSSRSSGSGNIFKDNGSIKRRQALPYVTHYSDSGFGSAPSAGSSCSYLPPPPPYRMRGSGGLSSKPQHKIHRSLSDSKYTASLMTTGVPTLPLLSMTPFNQLQSRDARGASWISLSPSPSMSTVSCPEYPELQDKLHRLAMARDSLQLQVSVLSEQVGAQKEKIKDLETVIALKRNNLTSTEELLQDKYHRIDECQELESKKMDLLAEVSSLKLRYATLEREKNETEKKLRLSQNEMDHVNQSMHGMVVQQQLAHHTNGHSSGGYMSPLREHRSEKNDDEMSQLRTAVQRLMADNEHKSLQINTLRNALDEQMRSRSQQEDFYASQRNYTDNFDVNAQIRRILMDEPSDSMSHSTSFPVSLSSTTSNGKGPRSTVQSSSSYNSSLSAVSPQHNWSSAGAGTPRQLHPIGGNQRVNNITSAQYCSPSPPAARQLAAELDELRRNGNEGANHNYSSASLPRGVGKASSTLTLPSKKLSVASGTSVVESDDEIARGRNLNNATSQSNLKNFSRERTRSSLRNIFSKLTRSTSQDQSNSFRRGSAARSTSTARLGSTNHLGTVSKRPPLSQFVDWRSEQLADWIAEIGYPQYMNEVSRHVRSGRHFLNMSMNEYEGVLNIKNPVHRKRVAILLRRIEEDIMEPANKWDVHQTLRWLDDIGLPQYKDVFAENVVDGPLLLSLTANDAVEMKVVNAHHYATLARSIQFLKKADFRFNAMEKLIDQNIVEKYPCPDVVVRWTHSATCEWLRKIDLAEFTQNLLFAGVPGALMIYEPSFTAESLAEILQMPPHKTLLRRHLTSHFNQLLGPKIIADKRDFLAAGNYPQISPTGRVKVVKKGFSLTRKKAKNEICLEPEELLCPQVLVHKYPTGAGDNSSFESSNV